MKTTIKLIVLAAVAVSFIGCTHKTLETRHHGIVVNASLSASTRADGDTWNQDQIGVMVVSGDDAMAEAYKNAEYETSSTSQYANFTSNTDAMTIYFTDSAEEITFAAYGPYQTSADAATLPGSEGVVSGSTESQNTAEAQEAIDYYFATGATATEDSPYVNFTDDYAFNHSMAKLYITIYAGNGQNYDYISAGTYTLSGLKHSGTFTVTSGVAAATGDATSDWSLNDNLPTPADYSTTGVTYTAILYPQECETLTFNATVNDEDYTKEIETGLSDGFQAGKYYTLLIQMSNIGVVVGSETGDDETVGSTINEYDEADEISADITGGGTAHQD